MIEIQTDIEEYTLFESSSGNTSEFRRRVGFIRGAKSNKILIRCSSSSTAQTLRSLSKTLDDLSSRHGTQNKDLGKTDATTIKPEPLANGDNRMNKQNSTLPEPSLNTSSPVSPVKETVKRRRRTIPSLSEYLSQREKEDKIGGEAGLLPISKPSTAQIQSDQQEKNLKDELMAGRKSKSVLGNAEIHEELGGQLAEVSFL